MRRLSTPEKMSLAREFLLGRRLLKRSPYLSSDELRSWQLERIRKLVAQAYGSVPLYRDLYRSAGFEPGDLKTWDDFRALPLVSKSLLIESYPDRALSREVERDRLIVSRSSGSSGSVLDVAYPARTLIRYILATLRIYEMGFAYRPWHRHVYIYTSPYPMQSVFGLYPLRFISTLEPIDRILAALVAARAQLVVCYPSHLRQIAEMATEEQLRAIRPRLISVSSEMSSQAERDHLSRVFGCPALDNYSSEELARIAAQCTHRTYHVFEDMNYIEVLDAAGRPTEGLGAVVGTNLHNFAMPLIRYQQNDLAEIGPSDCGCGWKFRSLRKLQGRKNDSFVLPSGRTLTSGFLLDATYEFLLRHDTAIRDFCLIQESPRSILLELVPGRGMSPEVRQSIVKRLRELFEAEVAIRLELVAQCEKTRTGKRNPIIRRASPRPEAL